MFGDHTREWKFLDFPFVAGADGTQLLTVASDAEPRFIYYAATNLDIPNLGYSRHFKELRELSLLLPPLPEQRKIAAILSSVDEAIEKTQAVIDQVQVVKKGLMQELLTKGLPGRHQKFKQTEIGTIPESWDVIRFGEAFRRVRNPVDVQPATLYREIGIRSHAKGIFHKEPVTGATLGNKQVFWIVPGALIINIVFAWERAVAVTSEGENGMICSHRFPMYVPDSSMDVKFAALYFQESAGAAMLEAISPGGAGRNRTLNQSKLVELPCPRPSLAEQMQIAETVVAIEQRLVADHRAISQLRTLKSALMQTLLTGQLRVTP
jgi:type I restriction enzyme S subunit